MSKSKAMKFTSMAEMPPSFGKLKQIIILKLIEGTTPRKGAKALRYCLIVTCIIDISHGQKGRRAEGQKSRRAEETGGTNRGGATAHGTRRRERMKRKERRERRERGGRVGNPPYGTRWMRGLMEGV